MTLSDGGDLSGIVSLAAIDRLTEVLEMRNAAAPDPARERAIGDLQTLRRVLADCSYPVDDDGEDSVRVLYILEQLGMLERTSLGTACARKYRTSAASARVADILLRHHEMTFGASRPSGRHRAPRPAPVPD
jgi:hypothetical protein